MRSQIGIYRGYFGTWYFILINLVVCRMILGFEWMLRLVYLCWACFRWILYTFLDYMLNLICNYAIQLKYLSNHCISKPIVKFLMWNFGFLCIIHNWYLLKYCFEIIHHNNFSTFQKTYQDLPDRLTTLCMCF